VSSAVAVLIAAKLISTIAHGISATFPPLSPATNAG
jgi:hypothetical protein